MPPLNGPPMTSSASRRTRLLAPASSWLHVKRRRRRPALPSPRAARASRSPRSCRRCACRTHRSCARSRNARRSRIRQACRSPAGRSALSPGAAAPRRSPAHVSNTLPQQLVWRDVPDRPCGRRIGHHVVRPQPRMPRAPPHRRLIDRAPANRPGAIRGQHADKTRPGDIVEFAGRPRHAGDLDMAAKPRKRPVECAHQPRRTVIARKRGAAPLVRAVEKPDAGETQRGRDRGDLRHIGRAASASASAA